MADLKLEYAALTEGIALSELELLRINGILSTLKSINLGMITGQHRLLISNIQKR